MIEKALLNSLWQGALIVGIAGFISIWLPQRNAATRYAVWFAALLALAIVPIATLLHPTEAVAGLPSPVVHGAAFASGATERTAAAGGSWLAILWLAGALFFFARLARSYARIAQLVRRATAAPAVGNNVLLSDDVSVPIATGVLSPVILIPRWLPATLERNALEGILQHERAHIRRMDILANFVQRFIEAGLFFNPWIYVIGRQVVKEREAACDDWAIRTLENPESYALCLSRLAQSMGRSHVPLLTPSAMGSGRMLVARIARLLDGKAKQVKMNYIAVGASIACFALLALLLGLSQGLAAPASCAFPNGYADAKVRNAAAPNIPKSVYKPGLSTAALVTVAPSGHPVSAKIVKSSGNGAVDKATVDAAMASTYSPELKACKAVTGTYLFHMETGP